MLRPYDLQLSSFYLFGFNHIYSNFTMHTCNVAKNINRILKMGINDNNNSSSTKNIRYEFCVRGLYLYLFYEHHIIICSTENWNVHSFHQHHIVFVAFEIYYVNWYCCCDLHIANIRFVSFSSVIHLVGSIGQCACSRYFMSLLLESNEEPPKMTEK